MFEKPPAPAEVALELFQQREQMDRLSLYRDRNGIWQCPKWADTSQLKAQVITTFLKNSTEDEESSFTVDNLCASLKNDILQFAETRKQKQKA